MLIEVDESKITRYIVEHAVKDLVEHVVSDVIVVGAGPSGLTAAYYLAKSKLKVLVLERQLSFGGGIGGGGMLFPKIVVEDGAHEILKEIGCKFAEAERGIYVVDPAELIAKLAASAIDAGAKIILGVNVEDVIYRVEGNSVRVLGVAAQWTAVKMANLHVDPLMFMSNAVIDATGHSAEVVSIAARKIPELNLKIKPETAMDTPRGENLVVQYTGKVCDGLYVTGMAVANTYGLPRMGPIFGGMLMSGRKVAEMVIRDLKRT